MLSRKKGEGKKLLFCVHMDEIGFMVTTVDDKGFIHFAPVGGINFTAAAYASVVFSSGIRGIMIPGDIGVQYIESFLSALTVGFCSGYLAGEEVLKYIG